MSSTSLLSTRGLVPGLPKSISVSHLDCRDCGAIQDVLNRVGTDATMLGVSFRLSTKRAMIEAVAFATPTKVFLVFLGKKSEAPPSASGVELSRVLTHPNCLLAGLNVARTALLLHRQTGAAIYGVELGDLPVGPKERVSAATLAGTHINPDARKRDIHALWLQEGNLDLALRAWLLASIAKRTRDKLAKFPKVATAHLHANQLSCLAQQVVNVELVEADKPKRVENDFDNLLVGKKKGELVLGNARYKTRVRKSAQTVIEINGGQAKAQAVLQKGKSTSLTIFQGKFSGKVERVSVVGREEYTLAEVARDKFLRRVLQGAAKLDASPYVRMLWFPDGSEKKSKKGKSKGMNKKRRKAVLEELPLFAKLNPSQKRVAGAMMADDEPLVIAHGPPGTGKTSTIAAALSYWQKDGQPAWVIAHSNVGVQNIATSLCEKGIDFRLIVSHEFHFEWHEHLYEDIERHLIRSDDFGTAFDPKNSIGNTKIILCTLSMLSNPSLSLYGIFEHVPVVRLIVDEASQIDTFEFKHLFDQFSRSEREIQPDQVLSKVCMFGDPNQLPPFGAELAPKMKTIFDFKHLKVRAYFLDTQYRMPEPLGDFISEHVYDSRLKSNHAIKGGECVKFIDVRKGREEKVGSSWKNTEEVNTIVNIIKKYYHNKEFCIITPYDPQRGAITAALEAAGVERWEHVYNVDSFQGHEAPYVIVSTVRTASAGFLRSLNRLNVMLTRCKQGMVVVTQRTFLQNGGKKTLVGKLAEHWEKKVGRKGAWADAMEVADRRASLPGAPGKSNGALVAKMSALSVSA